MLRQLKRYFPLLLLLCAGVLNVRAQTAERSQTAERVQPQSPSVTATAAPEQVRFAALGEAAQLRLEVFSLTGDKLFDSEARTATFLDWKLQDQQGARLPDGAYRCLLTVRTVAGSLTQAHGLIQVQAGQAILQAADAAKANELQELASGERRALLAAVPQGSALATALLAHDGEEARLVSGTGALTFRTGDFFAAQDQEQMRLTPDGKLGIGIKMPQAKLDVAGTIRTSEGIIFPDGTVQTTAYSSNSQQKPPKSGALNKNGSAVSAPEQTLTGSGTTNFIPKWTGSTTLGNSVLSESGGNIFLNGSFFLQSANGRVLGVNGLAPGHTVHFQYGGDSFNELETTWGGKAFFKAYNGVEMFNFNPSLQTLVVRGAASQTADILAIRNSAGVNLMSVTANGNVGAGTTTPAARMHALSNDTAVFGETISTLDSAAGIFGRINSTAPGAFSAGVRGVNNGTGTFGIGVHGSQAGSGWGIYGEAPSGRGVYGLSTTGIGVYGKSTGGNGIYAESQGGARNAAALRVNNGNTTNGMAAYMTNNSDFATAHFANNGPGEVLYLQALVDNQAGGGQCVACTRAFIKAVNWQENDTKFMVNQFGHVYSDSGFSTPAADFAEMLPAEEGLEAGDVLIIAEEGKLARSTQPHQASVAGVYSTKPGFVGGRPMLGDLAGHIPLAVVGIVPVKVTAENGPIRPGDLLTTSSTPGHAMRAGANPVMGTVIGKALGKLKEGRGVIQMLAVLQ